MEITSILIGEYLINEPFDPGRSALDSIIDRHCKEGEVQSPLFFDTVKIKKEPKP